MTNEIYPGKRLPDVLYDICFKGNEGEAAHVALNNIEEMLSTGKFSVVDEVLNVLDAGRLLPAVMMSIVSITFHAKTELSSRDTFINKVETSLNDRLGRERTMKLMANRR